MPQFPDPATPLPHHPTTQPPPPPPHYPTTSLAAVFLDRDGVLNRTFVREGVSYPPYTMAELEILPDVPGALQRLRNAGFLLIGVTNQPDVARGLQTGELVDRMNQHLLDRLPLTAVYVCPHDTPDGCDCRKPKPGMLLNAAMDYGVHLASSWMVGDRASDVIAGQAAGCRTILIDTPWSQGHRCEPDFRSDDLAAAAEIILRSPASRL